MSGADIESPFLSWFMGGFECSTHHRPDGQRLDLIAATAHDRYAAEDYRQLAALGLRTVRDGVRWHLVEPAPGRFDWSSLDPMIDAARTTGTQVIWDLLHYGWPDWANPWRPDFADRFTAFARAAAQRIGPGGCYVAINEISFLSWGGGEVGFIDPFVQGRGPAFKHILCRAAIQATHAIRAVDPAALMMSAEPLIRVHPGDDTPEAHAVAARFDAAQFEALDTLLGRRAAELGGGDAVVDVVGVNYYPYNQWAHGDPVRPIAAEDQIPLSVLLCELWQRYRKPLLIAETGCEDDARGPWLARVVSEVEKARAAGAQVLGICLYPVLDHPGWSDDRHCRNGLLCGFSAPPRPVFGPLAALISRSDGKGGMADVLAGRRILFRSGGAFRDSYAMAAVAKTGAIIELCDGTAPVPAPTRPGAAPDAAIIDLATDRALLDDLADMLEAQGVPFLLIGGATAQVPPHLTGRPVLLQPFASFQVVDALRALVG